MIYGLNFESCMEIVNQDVFEDKHWGGRVIFWDNSVEVILEALQNRCLCQINAEN